MFGLHFGKRLVLILSHQVQATIIRITNSGSQVHGVMVPLKLFSLVLFAYGCGRDTKPSELSQAVYDHF